MQPASASAPAPALVKALAKLLRPLVHALVAHGITYPYLSAMLKKVYVDVVDKDFPLEDKKQTASRISLMSGVHRKDVRRLLGEPAEETGPPKAVSVGARLIATWTGAPAYLDGRGKPRPLPRSVTDAAGVCFDSLVESIKRKDVRPRAVLDELERLGIVSIDEQDRVHLNTDAFVPSADFDEIAYYFGRNLRDHIAASAHNLSGEGEPFLERAVYYGRLTGESVATLEGMSREVAMEALGKVNREALKLAERDEKRSDADRRMTLGFYFFDAGDEGAGPDEA